MWQTVENAHVDVSKLSLADHIKTTISQIKTILSNSIARNRFLLCLYPWFISGLSYYGFFLSVKFVVVNKYILVFFTCLFDILFLFLMKYVINKVYRVLQSYQLLNIPSYLNIQYSKSCKKRYVKH